MDTVQVEDTVSEVAPPEAEATRLELAAEALQTVEAEDVGPADELEDAQDTQDEVSEESPQDEVSEESPQDEPEPVNIGHEYKTLRRRQRQMKRKEEAFDTRVGELDAKMAELESQTELIRLIREDPEAALAKFSERSGTSADDFYEKLTLRRLGGEYEEDGKDSALWNEIKQLRGEIKSRNEQQEFDQQEAAESQQQQRVQRAVDGHVSEICGIPESREFSERWPHLANLRPDILESRARYAIWWAMENSPKSQLPEVVDALDEVVGEEYKFTLDRLSASRQDQSSPEQNSEGQGVPGNGKPAAKPKALTLTNNDAAVTSRRGRDMTATERLQAAANALPDFKALVGN